MSHGGKREGAGRKPGVPNQLTRELREKAQSVGMDMLVEQARLALASELDTVRANLTEKVLNRGFGRPGLAPPEEETSTPARITFEWDPMKSEAILELLRTDRTPAQKSLTGPDQSGNRST